MMLGGQTGTPSVSIKNMTLGRFLIGNLLYYWRTNLAVIAGVATAVAVLSGALLVGHSVRDSLRDLIFQRLGSAEYVISSDRFFRADLAPEITSSAGTQGMPESCPMIYLQGVLVHEESGRRAHDVHVYGIDERFWRFHGAEGQKAPEGRAAAVGSALARHLGIRSGDGLLLRVETQRGIPRESLFGRREDVGRTVRLVCGEILPAERLGEFALRPNQGEIFSMFVPLQRLQRDLAQPGRANAMLLASGPKEWDLQEVRRQLKQRFTLDDIGVGLRLLPSESGISVESARILLDAEIARAASAAAADAGLPSSGVFTYLANSLRAGGHEIPYSVITAVDLGRGAMRSVRGADGLPLQSAASAERDAIWLNEWAGRNLGASAGDAVEVDYYLWQDDGGLVTRTARFRLAGIVGIGGDVDASLAPDFPGITEARDIRDWDPPFPLDLRRIRAVDEEYWHRFRATPKAFVTLARGQELWQSRFGKLSAVRIALAQEMDPVAARESLAASLRNRIDPELAGFAVTDVRRRGLEASQGSTDFGEYFLYFSFFLIAAAILLAALFFRLGIEQRVREIGTLKALGFSRNFLLRIFLLEGAALSVAGSFLGLAGAIGYGGLMVIGLRTWWAGATGMSRLYLHVTPGLLALGAAGGVLTAVAAIAWTLRGLCRSSPRTLLAGVLESHAPRGRRTLVTKTVAPVAFLAALLTLLGSAYGRIPDVLGFFVAGLLLLVSLLSVMSLLLRRPHPSPISGHGWPAFFRLGARNATHRPGRSLLCIALIASATFIIVSVEAFRKDPHDISPDPQSGTGGYALLATSALPVVHDPNSAAGREALGIPASEVPELAHAAFVPFRERPGDDASCLNLYAPQEPRILGAPQSFLAGGRFSFQNSLAATPEEKRNPWLLLDAELPESVIPAIGDANTIQYVLHLAVGQELTVRGDEGRPVRLRLVAALRDTVLQGELIISEANFLRTFPGREGYRFFLLEVPPDAAPALAQLLMERLSQWGFEAVTAAERLAAYHRVENTYLSTFQGLGALGLVLGTAGLATVLLRNVLERRRELALLRAVGYRRGILSVIIVAENLALMVAGLACGTACALIAIVPAVRARGVPFPFAMVSLVLSAVLVVGLAASLLAVVAAFRSPLLASLQSE